MDWSRGGGIATLLASAVLAGPIAWWFWRGRHPIADRNATREFLVNYHQILHETYGGRRPFARLRAWIQAEAAGLGRTDAEFESLGREFLAVGLASLGQFAASARNLRVSRAVAKRLTDCIDQVESALRTALARRSPERAVLARDVVERMEALSHACLAAYRQVAERHPCRPGTELKTLLGAPPALEGIGLQVVVGEGTDCLVLFDPAALRAIVGELIHNSTRAVAAVRAPEIRVSLQAHSSDPRYILLVVSDNGPGIPEELRDRLCRPGASSGPDGGFGLAHAGDVARSWLGDLDVGNRAGGGAVAALKLRVLAAGPG